MKGWPSIEQRVQHVAHGLELQAGFAPQARTDALVDIAPEAMQGGQLSCFAAHESQPPAHLPEAGRCHGPVTGVEVWIGHQHLLSRADRGCGEWGAAFAYCLLFTSPSLSDSPPHLL